MHPINNILLLIRVSIIRCREDKYTEAHMWQVHGTMFRKETYKSCWDGPNEQTELWRQLTTMFSILLVLTLICLCTFQISIGHHPDLKNVAYSKKVTLSSRYHRVHYPGWNAVNGVLSDFAHSGHERSPWLRIDLGRNFRIHEIEVFARSDCCSKYKKMLQLSNTIVRRLPFYQGIWKIFQIERIVGFLVHFKNLIQCTGFFL